MVLATVFPSGPTSVTSAMLPFVAVNVTGLDPSTGLTPPLTREIEKVVRGAGSGGAVSPSDEHPVTLRSVATTHSASRGKWVRGCFTSVLRRDRKCALLSAAERRTQDLTRICLREQSSCDTTVFVDQIGTPPNVRAPMRKMMKVPMLHLAAVRCQAPMSTPVRCSSR